MERCARASLAGLAAAGVAGSLQGCFLTPSTTTTTTLPRSTTTTLTVTHSTSTTTTHHDRTPPMSPEEAVKFLNAQYTGFRESDDSSPLGVTLSMAAQDESFYRNIYCHTFDNPVLHQTGCSNGYADCRMSASLYNHQIGVTAAGTAVLGFLRRVGYVFNQTMVEEYFGKCSFVWDGATERKYNNGCGITATIEDCSSSDTAYRNVCPTTGKTCTAKDQEVQSEFCEGFGGTIPIPATHIGYQQCLVPGAAIDFHGQHDWEPQVNNNLRTMVKARLLRNNGSDAEGPNLAKWNEVVIDEQLLMPKIWFDPAVVIPAFVYVKTVGDQQFRKAAEKMRDEFCKLNFLDPKIPVVAFDATVDVTQGKGPFVLENDDEAMLV